MCCWLESALNDGLPSLRSNHGACVATYGHVRLEANRMIESDSPGQPRAGEVIFQ